WHTGGQPGQRGDQTFAVRLPGGLEAKQGLSYRKVMIRGNFSAPSGLKTRFNENRKSVEPVGEMSRVTTMGGVSSQPSGVEAHPTRKAAQSASALGKSDPLTLTKTDPH